MLDITKCLVEFNLRSILQLINSICNNFQKLLKYFSGTAIFVFLNTPLSSLDSFLKKLDLYLKDIELVVVTLGFITPIGNSSLLNCRKLPDLSE